MDNMKYQELKDWLKARRHPTTGDTKDLLARATALASGATSFPVTSDDISTTQVGAISSSAVSQSPATSVMVSEHTSSLFSVPASSPSASSEARSKYFSRHEMEDSSSHGLVLRQRAKAIEERHRIREEMEYLKEQDYLRRMAEEKEAWEQHMELQNREYLLTLKRQEREFKASMDLERQQRELEGQEEVLGLVIGDDDCQEKVPSPFTSQSSYYGHNTHVTASALVHTVDTNTKPLSSTRTNNTFAPVSSLGQSMHSAAVPGYTAGMPILDTGARVTPQHERFSRPPIQAPGAWRFGANASSGHVSTVASELSEHFDLISMPKPTPMSFSGDPMQYHMFINSFITNVDSKNVSDATKLCRLFELCQGKARTTINPCALGDASRGYARAKQLLKERFGDDYVISEAWIKKICGGSVVKANSGESSQAFADEVRDCVETLRSMNQLHEVDTRSRLVKLMQRLPDSLQNRWRKKAVYARDTTGEYPNIAMFLRFLEEVSREVNDPIFGYTADNDRRDNQDKRSHQTSKSKQVKAMAVEVGGKPDQEKKDKVKCPQCSGGHPLYVCRDFKKLSASERLQAAKEKKLCYSCLKPANHVMRDCNFDRVCGIDGCTYKHSRFLHAGFLGAKTADESKPEEGSTSGDTPTAVSAHVSTVLKGIKKRHFL